MIPDNTKVWVIVYTVNPAHQPYALGTILRVIETTWGETGRVQFANYQAREQSMIFFRPDDPPWKGR